MGERIRLNIGCGTTPTPGWLNLDNSLTVRLIQHRRLWGVVRRSGVLGVERVAFGEVAVQNKVRYADVRKGIPCADGEAEAIYNSHMLEHLDRDEARMFLRECMRALCPGGILRIGVPDLARIVSRYQASGDADAFVESLTLVAPNPKGAWRRLTYAIVGHRHHLWMYDARSLRTLLREEGFVDPVALPAGQTTIPDPMHLDLAEKAGESLYVEAQRP